MGLAMHNPENRRPLSIPSFASERCRAMTDALMQTLQGIPPTNDTALEDRALACFIVACGELAAMKNTAQCDTLVNQLTIVGRRLVGAASRDVHNEAADKAATGHDQVEKTAPVQPERA